MATLCRDILQNLKYLLICCYFRFFFPFFSVRVLAVSLLLLLLHSQLGFLTLFLLQNLAPAEETVEELFLRASSEGRKNQFAHSSFLVCLFTSTPELGVCLFSLFFFMRLMAAESSRQTFCPPHSSSPTYPMLLFDWQLHHAGAVVCVFGYVYLIISSVHLFFHIVTLITCQTFGTLKDKLHLWHLSSQLDTGEKTGVLIFYSKLDFIPSLITKALLPPVPYCLLSCILLRLFNSSFLDRTAPCIVQLWPIHVIVIWILNLLVIS